MKRLYAARSLFIILLVLWMAFIFCLSAQSATQSSELSRGFVYKGFCIIYPNFEGLSVERQTEIISSVMFPVRKAAHFAEYAVLGALSFLAVCSYEKISFKARVGISFTISLLYSVSDEIHQIFVPGRACRLLDVCVDCAGALLAILFASFLFVRRKKDGQERN